MRQLTNWNADLRRWQDTAYGETMTEFERGAKNFLCVGTPGSGKTKYALRFAHKLLQAGYIKRVVVLVHTDHLKRQWALAASEYGIDFDPDFVVLNGYHGIVITYQALGMQLERIHQLVINAPTLVIADEVHHAGENLTWGNALKLAFEQAAYRLNLSGTPFRSDSNQIPFVEYENGISRSNFTYGYAEALADGVVRPIYFPAYDGKMEWRTDGKRFVHSFTDILSDVKAGERLRTALSIKGDWMRHIITDAEHKLNEIRQSHFNAGGLIFAIDQKHARQIARLVKEVTGEDPAVAVSEDRESSKIIEKYAKSGRKWLICVKMVSEGVDIPRLRVGIYATNVKSELFFRQVVGRFVRMIKGMPEQNAYLFIPKDIEIVKFAREIEKEREHVLRQRREFLEGSIPPEDKKKTEKEFEAISAEVTGTTQLSLFGNKVANAFGLPGALAEMIAVSTPQTAPDERKAAFQMEAALRDDITSLSRLVARKMANGSQFVDWEKPHKDWIAIGGRRIEQETITELQRRKVWLERQL